MSNTHTNHSALPPLLQERAGVRLSRAGVRPLFTHTFDFRKWLGRTLNKYEYTLINRLERHRRRRAVKVHIIDQPGHDSTQLIVDYMRYIQHMHPLQPCVIYGHTRKQARQFAKTLPGKIITASCRRPNTVRGMSFDMALVLNPPPKYLPALLSTVMPVIPDRPHCLMIILSSSPTSLKGRARKRLLCRDTRLERPPHATKINTACPAPPLLQERAGERLPRLPDFYYSQLIDPPDPPPRPYTNPIFIEFVDPEIKNIKPAVGTLGSSVRPHALPESSI